MSHLSMSIGKYAEVAEHDWPSLQVNALTRILLLTCILLLTRLAIVAGQRYL